MAPFHSTGVTLDQKSTMSVSGSHELFKPAMTVAAAAAAASAATSSATTTEELANNTFERVDSLMAGDVIPNGSDVSGDSRGAVVKTNGGCKDHEHHQVRVVQLQEWKAAAASLAEAFAQDASSMYFINTPDRQHWTPEQKWKLHLRVMEYITYAHLLQGLVLTCGPNYDCVALWLGPGQTIDDSWTIVRSGLWRLYYLFSAESRTRFFTEFMPLLHDTKRSVLGARDDADSWYLVYIGTRPAGRGRGYARAVIEEVTRKRADHDAKKCYLESTHAVNRVIYGKLGFVRQKVIYLQREPKGNVELDIMVREPSAESTSGE